MPTSCCKEPFDERRRVLGDRRASPHHRMVGVGLVSSSAVAYYCHHCQGRDCIAYPSPSIWTGRCQHRTRCPLMTRSTALWRPSLSVLTGRPSCSNICTSARWLQGTICPAQRLRRAIATVGISPRYTANGTACNYGSARTILKYHQSNTSRRGQWQQLASRNLKFIPRRSCKRCVTMGNPSTSRCAVK